MSSQPTKRERIKPVRYWPGRAPTDQPDPLASSDTDTSSASDEELDNEHQILPTKTRAPVASIQVQSLKDIDVTTVEQDRARLVRHRRAQQEMSEVEEESEDDDDDDDEMESQAKRRQLLRQRLLERRRAEQGELEKEELVDEAVHVPSQEEEETKEEEEEEDEYTTEYETESEEEVLLKPVFIPKSKRITIEERERELREMQEAEERREAERQARKEAAHQMVATIIKHEIENNEKEKEDNSIVLVDDTDGLDPVAELEAWKLRELKRIRRDLEERERIEAEQREIERRRKMTDQEIMREDAEKLEADRNKRKNSKFRFMQKYYHKGAFFTDQEILKRDYTEPTPDMPRVELLPKIMQVRDFGKRSRTKWTHLVAEDTTEKSAAWAQDNPINRRILKRMGGMKEQPMSRKRHRNE